MLVSEGFCLNCSQPYKGNFCQNCGQRTDINRITFKETAGNFLSSIFALDGPLLLTLKFLLTNPGKVFRGFIEGQRKVYYKPVALFVLSTIVYLIIRSLIQYDPLEGSTEKLDNSNREFLLLASKAAGFMVSHINHIMVLLALSIGLMLKLFFRKQYNLAEYVSIGFYVTSFYIILGLPLMLCSKYISQAFQQVQFLLVIGYMVYSFRSLMERKGFGVHLKFMMVALLSFALYSAAGFLISMAVVWVQIHF